jgi:hypothetical protein
MSETERRVLCAAYLANAGYGRTDGQPYRKMQPAYKASCFVNKEGRAGSLSTNSSRCLSLEPSVSWAPLLDMGGYQSRMSPARVDDPRARPRSMC